MSKFQSKISVIVLAVLFFGFSILNCLVPKADFDESENRLLAEFPAFSITTLLNGDFDKDFQSYENDRFLGRHKLISLKSGMKTLIGEREVNGVYLCRSGRMVNALKPWDIEEDNFSDNISEVERYLKNSGLKKENCSVIIAPNSGYIYKNDLPDNTPLFCTDDTLNQIKNGINSAEFVDVAGILKGESFKTYYNTDHHWTSDGAKKVYESITGKKSKLTKNTFTTDFKGSLYRKTLIDCTSETIEYYTKENRNPVAVCDNKNRQLFELNAKGDKYNVFLNGNYAEVKIKGFGKGNLAIIKDSFANSFVQFALEDYENIYMIDLRYYNGDMKNYVKNNNIDELMFLYGFDTFAEDKNLYKLNF